MVNQAALHMFSLLGKDNSKPITLGWCDKITCDNGTLTAKPLQIHKNCKLETEEIIKRNRKLPITWKDDFYGIFS